jgi:hypothetical protein
MEEYWSDVKKKEALALWLGGSQAEASSSCLCVEELGARDS